MIAKSTYRFLRKLVPATTVFFLFVFASPALSNENSEKTYLISVISEEPTSEFASHILASIYERSGLSVTFREYSGKKAIENANAGITDGENLRIPGMELRYPNLIPVPTPFFELKGRLYVTDRKMSVTTLAQAEDMRVGYLHAIIITDRLTQQFKNRVASDTPHEMFLSLNSGDIDVAVAPELTGGLEILAHFRNSTIRAVGEPVFHTPLHHYVNNKNREIVPILDATIKMMKKTGRLEELYREQFDNYLKQHKPH